MFKLTDMLKSKLRLYIEYALIGLLLIVAGFAAYNYTTRLKLDNKVTALQGRVATAEQRVAQAEEVNKAQSEALATVERMRTLDSTVLQGLGKALDTINSRDQSVRARLTMLEKSNEAVRSYLNGNVPDPVGCVLDRTCPDQGKAGSAPSTRATAATMRGSPARALQEKR
jgi:hypothetical protein